MSTKSAAAWLAGACVLVAGTGTIAAGGERRIALRAAANDGLAAQLAANELIVRSRGALLAERGRLRTDLGRAQNGEAAAPATAQYLREASDAAQQAHATITAIAVPNAAGPRVLGGAGNADELTITLEGRYRDVLDAIRRLSMLHVPAGVDVGSIVRSTRPGTPAVAAVVHVSLLQHAVLGPATDGPHRP